MAKISLGPQTIIYPKPALLVGANVNGKPNFIMVAWGGIANGEPPMISVALNNHRYTLGGIKENQTFSVNIPSTDIAKEADYCGITSGANVDKVKATGFKVFYGKSGTAPLVEQCPLNIECVVEQIIVLGSHSLVLGKIVDTFVSEDCLTDGQPDIKKMKPLVYAGAPSRDYLEMGKFVAKAYHAGLELKVKGN